MSTRNLIDAIASGSALDIESAFEDTMAEKVSVQIEAKRLQIAQTMFTTEEVDLDEGSKSSIRHLYHQYATAYFSSGSQQRPGDLDHHTISAKIEKIHGKKVLGHIKRATDANSRGDTDGELRHLHNAGVHYATEEVEIDEEQLDELSPKTLGSYVKKASKSVSNISAAAGGTDETRYAHWGSLMKKQAAKRQKNISKAVNKLVHKANEEVDLDEEQLDELSPKTLGSYVKKATSSNDERSISNLSSKAAHKLAVSGDGGDDGEAEDKKSYTRSKGIARAVNKLTKEEVEEQSEQE